MRSVHKMRSIAADVARSVVCVSVCVCVCVSVCLLVTRMYCAKAAEPIEMLYVALTLVGPKNIIIDGGSGYQTNSLIRSRKG